MAESIQLANGYRLERRVESGDDDLGGDETTNSYSYSITDGDPDNAPYWVTCGEALWDTLTALKTVADTAFPQESVAGYTLCGACHNGPEKCADDFKHRDDCPFATARDMGVL